MGRSRFCQVICGLVFLGVTLACGSDDVLGPDARQGIAGVVLIGPQCPVQSVDNPCPDLPYQAWIDVRNSSGHSHFCYIF